MGPCLLSIVYMAAWVLFLLLLNLHIPGEIFSAVVDTLESTPWRTNPERLLREVHGGPEVYEWLTKVFINQMYRADPSQDMGSGFCTAVYPCLINEGHVSSDDECAANTVAGFRNCPTFMGGGFDCCEACAGNCSLFEVQVAGARIVENITTPNLAEACSDELPGWLPYLTAWPQDETTSELSSPTVPLVDSNFTFCPERLPRTPSAAGVATPRSGRSVRVATFNQVLMGRITMKRIKLESTVAKAFRNAYPTRQASRKVGANFVGSSDDQTSFGNTEIFHYQKDAGFLNNGGFVWFIDFNKTETEVRNGLANLKDNHWFDQNQGSFVLEMVLYNGNYETFLYLTIVFEHMAEGRTEVYVDARPLNMSYTNSDQGFEYYFRYFLLAVMVILFFSLLRSEIDDMSSNPGQYLTNIMQLLQLASLGLSCAAIGWWVVTVYSYSYRRVGLPLPTEEVRKQEVLSNLVDLATNMQTFVNILAVNILLVVIRCITVVSSMSPQSNVIFLTINRAKGDLLSFVIVFMILFAGFTFSGFYLCGQSSSAFTNIITSMLTCLKMVMGEPMRAEIEDGDRTFGIAYFFGFHLFFIIIQNMLLSMICLAYYKESEMLKDPHIADKYPLKRFMRQVQNSLQAYSRKLLFCTNAFFTALFGTSGGGGIRVNYEQVDALRDKRRAFRAPVRKVLYHPRQDDVTEARRPDADIRLRAEEPFYRNGMMNYYVENIEKDSPAGEQGVKEEWRLKGINRQGMVGMDRRQFRSPFNYKKQYNRDPRRILLIPVEHLPVTLEFEGYAAPYSIDCSLSVIFIVVLTIFLVASSRVEDSWNLTALQRYGLTRPDWTAYNPTRVRNFSTIDGMQEFNSWLNLAVRDYQYGCVGQLGQPPDCLITEPDTMLRRDHWFLYAGAEGINLFGPEGGVGFEPGSARGLSLGYVPWSEVHGGSSTWTAPVQYLPRLQNWNGAVMSNNHIRVTMQLACFTENLNTRWQGGYPYVLDPVILDNRHGCASAECMKEMIERGKDCLTSDGKRRDPRVLNGSTTGIRYMYSEDGTYNNLGGIAIGMGTTWAEFQEVYHLLQSDTLLESDSVSSIVMEYVTFNENLDLFTYVDVLLSLSPSGQVQKEFAIKVFPLNIFSMGFGMKATGQRVLNWICWGLYILCTLVATIFFFRDIHIQWRITAEERKVQGMFLYNFFAETWWNYVDFSVVVVNIVTLVLLIRYMFVGTNWDFSFQSWVTTKFKFESIVSESTRDPFENFSRAAYFFSAYTNFAAVSVLLVFIRCIKFFVTVPQLRVVINTLTLAFKELLFMVIVLFCLLLSFAFMFNAHYGVKFDRFASWSSSFYELFIYMTGHFETDDLYHISPIFFTIVFMLVQFVFYFILANMFLATLVYKWQEARKDAQDSIWVSAVKCYASLPCCRHRKTKLHETAARKMTLDKDFWKTCAVLNYLGNFDETGAISVSRDKDKKAKHGKHGEDAEDHAAIENGHAFAALQGRSLEKIVKRAHMEIASAKCRAVRPADPGGGVGPMLDERSEAAPPGDDDGEHKTSMNAGGGNNFMGILDMEVDPSTSEKIRLNLEERFKHQEQHAGELWLDALVTVLEEFKAFDRLQAFFLPPKMIRPRTHIELNNFDTKKQKMEHRLDIFLHLIMAETYAKHYEYLKECAKIKEKVLKQQSLVLADYLDKLDSRIKELQAEIKVLERRNVQMRTHVSPLL